MVRRQTLLINNYCLFSHQLGKCLSTEFRCVDSAQCIAAEKTKDYRCNTIKDCQDGSDEKTAAGCCEYFSVKINVLV